MTETYECPVCLEEKETEGLLCSNGHEICLSCSSLLNQEICPTCRVPFVSESNLVTRMSRRQDRIRDLKVAITTNTPESAAEAHQQDRGVQQIEWRLSGIIDAIDKWQQHNWHAAELERTIRCYMENIDEITDPNMVTATCVGNPNNNAAVTRNISKLLISIDRLTNTSVKLRRDIRIPHVGKMAINMQQCKKHMMQIQESATGIQVAMDLKRPRSTQQQQQRVVRQRI